MPRGSAAVGLARREHLAELTLDLRASHGRFTPDSATAFADACARCDDDEIWVVWLRGRGGDFCTGIEGRLDRWPRLTALDFVAALAGVRQPVVASLHGRVEAEGFELALAADLRVLHRRTRFVMSQVRSGRLPTFGGTQRLPRMIGTERALRGLLLGEAIPARRAVDWGLAVGVAANPDRAARRIVAALLERGPIALRYAKEAVRRAMDFTLDDGARFEHDLYVLLETTRDRAEGVDAFLGARKPKFRGN
jgi:enoyl-CoA hydratase/carnithine racemase